MLCHNLAPVEMTGLMGTLPENSGALGFLLAGYAPGEQRLVLRRPLCRALRKWNDTLCSQVDTTTVSCGKYPLLHPSR